MESAAERGPGEQAGDSGPGPGEQAGDSGPGPGEQAGDSGPGPGEQAGERGLGPGAQAGDSGPGPGEQAGDSGPGPGEQAGERGLGPGAQAAEGEAGERGPGPGEQAGERGLGPGAQAGDSGPGPGGQAGERGPGPEGQAGVGEPEGQAGVSGPEPEGQAGVSEPRLSPPMDQDTASGSGGEAGVGPEGSKRLKLFSAAMETTMEKMLETASFERFAQSYKPVYKIQPQFTHSVYKQLITQLQTSMQEEINQISEDGLFERALPKLDQLERESEGRSEPAWRPTGSPADDLRSHLVPYQLQQCQYLRLKVKRAKEENAALAQSVLQGRGRIAKLQGLRDQRCQAWQECNKICRQFELDEQ
ncbi:polyamine-modulated factor 1 [Heptranchias perlo]|uniref:polyamine-modulated factor 1 n=1 Tax=Heptranchias perlo TaxID=212740 RepID=UPI00355A00CA